MSKFSWVDDVLSPIVTVLCIPLIPVCMFAVAMVPVIVWGGAYYLVLEVIRWSG